MTNQSREPVTPGPQLREAQVTQQDALYLELGGNPGITLIDPDRSPQVTKHMGRGTSFVPLSAVIAGSAQNYVPPMWNALTMKYQEEVTTGSLSVSLQENVCTAGELVPYLCEHST